MFFFLYLGHSSQSSPPKSHVTFSPPHQSSRMLPPLTELLYPGVLHDLSRVMIALVLGHLFHSNVLLLLVLTLCSLPLLIVSWLHGGDPFLIFFWPFTYNKDREETARKDSAGNLKRGGGIRRKLRDSLGSIGGNNLGEYLGLLGYTDYWGRGFRLGY